MPLKIFGKGMSAKRSPRRSVSLSSLRPDKESSSEKLSQSFNQIKVNFGDQCTTFEEGEWIIGNT